MSGRGRGNKYFNIFQNVFMLPGGGGRRVGGIRTGRTGLYTERIIYKHNILIILILYIYICIYIYIYIYIWEARDLEFHRMAAVRPVSVT